MRPFVRVLGKRPFLIKSIVQAEAGKGARIGRIGHHDEGRLPTIDALGINPLRQGDRVTVLRIDIARPWRKQQLARAGLAIFKTVPNILGRNDRIYNRGALKADVVNRALIDSAGLE